MKNISAVVGQQQEQNLYSYSGLLRTNFAHTHACDTTDTFSCCVDVFHVMHTVFTKEQALSVFKSQAEPHCHAAKPPGPGRPGYPTAGRTGTAGEKQYSHLERGELIVAASRLSARVTTKTNNIAVQAGMTEPQSTEEHTPASPALLSFPRRSPWSFTCMCAW